MQQEEDKKLGDMVKEYRKQETVGVKIAKEEVISVDGAGRVVLYGGVK